MGYRNTGHESLPYKYSRKLCALFGLHGFMATMVKTVCGLFFQIIYAYFERRLTTETIQ